MSCERLQDITDLLIAAFQRGDPVVVSRGFHRWLDALIDAGHSVGIRWSSDPVLDASRDLLARFPSLWILEPSFPDHLRDFIDALNAGDEERAIETTRAYYRRVDAAFMKVLEGTMSLRVTPTPGAVESDNRPSSRPPSE